MILTLPRDFTSLKPGSDNQEPNEGKLWVTTDVSHNSGEDTRDETWHFLTERGQTWSISTLGTSLRDEGLFPKSEPNTPQFRSQDFTALVRCTENKRKQVSFLPHSARTQLTDYSRSN